jgi:hypothetical protein
VSRSGFSARQIATFKVGWIDGGIALWGNMTAEPFDLISAAATVYPRNASSQNADSPNKGGATAHVRYGPKADISTTLDRVIYSRVLFNRVL